MYLTHYFVVCAFLRILFRNIVFSNPILEIKKMLVCYLVAWGIAYLSYLIIEKNYRDIQRKFKENYVLDKTRVNG